jgi:hypothetical protein
MNVHYFTYIIKVEMAWICFSAKSHSNTCFPDSFNLSFNPSPTDDVYEIKMLHGLQEFCFERDEIYMFPVQGIPSITYLRADKIYEFWIFPSLS